MEHPVTDLRAAEAVDGWGFFSAEVRMRVGDRQWKGWRRGRGGGSGNGKSSLEVRPEETITDASVVGVHFQAIVGSNTLSGIVGPDPGLGGRRRVD